MGFEHEFKFDDDVVEVVRTFTIRYEIHQYYLVEYLAIEYAVTGGAVIGDKFITAKRSCTLPDHLPWGEVRAILVTMKDHINRQLVEAAREIVDLTGDK